MFSYLLWLFFDFDISYVDSSIFLLKNAGYPALNLN